MKAILVIDEMPENCGKCRLADFGKCWVSTSYIHLTTEDRPKECPLKSMPKRNKYRANTLHGVRDEYETGYADGWNWCLKMIEEGGE